MHERRRNQGRIAFLSVLVLVFFVSGVNASWNYTVISPPDLYSLDPSLSGNYLLYTASAGDPQWDNATRVVQLYDLSTGKQARLAVSEPGAFLTGPEISGDSAVWFSEARPGASADIPNRLYLYAIAEKNLTVLPASPSASWPKIDGGTVLWSERTGDSVGNSLVMYNISTGTATPVPGISSFDSVDVGFNGRYILYTDAATPGLRLYDGETGAITPVYVPVINATIREGFSEPVLGRDFVLYRRDVISENLREMYSELCLYSITAKTTVLISPLTGEVTATLSKADRNAVFNVRAAGPTQAVWDWAEGIGNDRILVLDVPSLKVSSVSPGMYVGGVAIDGPMMVWQGTPAIFGRGVIALGTISGDAKRPATASPGRAPGFDMPAVAGGLAGAFLLAIARRWT